MGPPILASSLAGHRAQLGSGHETHTDATGVVFVSSNWVLGGVSSPLGVTQAVEI